jgi:hypothetical protein
MSASNILRLLRDALVLHQEKLDMVSGDVLKIRPATDDTGAIHIGDGAYDCDVKVFLGSSGEYVLFDVGNSQLQLACPLSLTGAFSVATPALTAEHGAGAVGTGAAPTTTRYTVNGTIITETKIDLTGLASVNTANDVIGKTGPAYIGWNVVAYNGIIYKAELICLETPAGAGADTDINVVANAAADLAKDGAGGTTYGVNGGTQAAGQVVANLVQGLTANHYFYLTAGTGGAGTYTAGQLIFRTYGHALLA